MTFKVAVATSTGEYVDVHFGRADEFLIFEINEDGTFNELEKRKNAPPCGAGGHDQNVMQTAVDLIEDVKVLLVANVGPAAINLLIEKKIKPYVTSYPVEDALKELSIREKELHD